MGEEGTGGSGVVVQTTQGGLADAPARIPFHKPYIAGRELYHIAQTVTFENIAGDGLFTERAARFFEEEYDVGAALLVTSCTSALELSVELCDLEPGDEVITPSFGFVSSANAIMRAGGVPRFVDIRPDTLNIDERLIEAAVNERTRAIMPVHYAGVSAEMDEILAIANRHGLRVIEDAAQAVSSRYRGRALGSIGDLGCYSFHDTKNFVAGEGGALCVNDPALLERAEILRDKGTNRRKFWRGEVDKYTWVDVGSSYVMSEILAAFLVAQLEGMPAIQAARTRIFDRYHELLEPLEVAGLLRRPTVPPHCESNAHLYYVLLPTEELRTDLIKHLAASNIHAVFHYVPLHTSPMGRSLGWSDGDLPVTEDLSGRLLRLPMFAELSLDDVDRVVEEVVAFFQRQT